MTLLTVIVPTRNVMSTGKLEEIFEGISSVNDQSLVDVLVADYKSEDGLVALTDRYNFVKVLDCPEGGTAKQINYALEFAMGEYILFNHARSFLSDYSDVVDICEKGELKWGYFFLKFDHKHWFLKWVVAYLSTYLRPGLGGAIYLDQCNLVQSEYVKKAGGFPEIDLMEDVQFSKRLRGIGLKPKLFEKLFVVTSAHRFLHNGIYTQHWWNMYIKTAYWLGWKSVGELNEMYK